MAEEGRDDTGKFIEGHDHSQYSEDEIKSFIKPYIAHIESGFTKKSFVPCDYRTLEHHLQTNPNLLPEKRLVSQAFRKNMMFWEEKGMKGLMVGKRFNAVTWIFNMKNRFKEDWMDKMVREDSSKIDANVKHSGSIKVNFGSNNLRPPRESTTDS